MGDIHAGRDLFDALIAAIEKDNAARSHAETTILLLGDVIDRRPDNTCVIASARSPQARRTCRHTVSHQEERFIH
mgnify:CR=1 FL=1